MLLQPVTLVLVCGLLLSGCIAGNNTDLSRRQPFSAYSTRTVPLLRPAYVFDNVGQYLTMPRYNISEYPINSARLVDGRWEPRTDYGICRLPSGHPVQIDSVKLKAGFDSGTSVTALGRTFLPSAGREVAFFFSWGGTDVLFRAPWEPLAVPRRRHGSFAL